MQRHARVFHAQVLTALHDEGIHLLRWKELDADERKQMTALFTERVWPVLTPLAVDPAHPFPYISGLSLNLAVLLVQPGDRQGALRPGQGAADLLPLRQRSGDQRFVPLEDVIAAHLDRLFPGMEVLQHHTFRVTRNEDLEVEEDDAENLLKALEKELPAAAVRLRRCASRSRSRSTPMSSSCSSRSSTSREREVFHLPGPLDLTGLHGIADLDRPELKYPAFVPHTHAHLAEVESASPVDIFAAVGRRDVLLHHPYDSFATSVQRFLEQAAADPQVLAIKQTLYRTSGDSPDHRRPDRRRRGGQAGARARRDQGPLRRAGQHPLGAQAGAGRVPCRVRRRRPEDALQARAGRARRARRHAAATPTSAPATTTRRRRASTRTSGC